MADWRRLLTLAMLAFLQLVWVLAEGQPVGMIVQSTGRVVLQRSGTRQDARLADLLYANDQLSAVEGEASFLFCPVETHVSVAQGTSLKLSERGFEVAQGQPPATRTIRRCTLPQIALGSESLERAGSIRIRKAGLPEITLFLGGPVATETPRFRWNALAQTEEYEVSLLDEDGTEIWRKSTSASHLAYPDDQPPLTSGTYLWTVEATREGRAVAEATTRFEVRQWETALIPAGPLETEEALRTAVELETAGYFAEAAHFYSQLRTRHPEDERLTRHLVWLYQQAGLERAAQVERAKLQ